MHSSKEDFTFSKRLGTGTYGTVWQAVRKQDGKTYAVKELDLRYLQKQVKRYLLPPGAMPRLLDCFSNPLVKSTGAGRVHT